MDFLTYAEFFRKAGHDCSLYGVERADDFDLRLLKSLGYRMQQLNVTTFKTFDKKVPITIKLIKEDPVSAVSEFALGSINSLNVQSTLKALRQIIQNEKPDVVSTSFADVLTLIAAHQIKIPAHVSFMAVDGFDEDDDIPSLLKAYGPSYCTANSHFVAQYVREKLGLICDIAYCPVDKKSMVHERKSTRKFILQVNDQPRKGAILFLALAKLLPDYKFAIVKNDLSFDWSNFGLSFNLPNIEIWPSTQDMKKYYAKTKILLVPTLCEEGFGRVALEGLLNGIPVLGNRVGGLPEVIGKGGVVMEMRIPKPRPERFYYSASLHKDLLMQYITVITDLMEDRKSYQKACRRSEIWAKQFAKKMEDSVQTHIKNLERIVSNGVAWNK